VVLECVARDTAFCRLHACIIVAHTSASTRLYTISRRIQWPWTDGI